MSPTHHDVIVIGAGPIGTSTAMHLAERGVDVALIGPEEPVSAHDHDGTWSGHYDEGRLAHVLEVPLMTALLSTRSARRFRALQEQTGIEFTTPTHSVTVMPAKIEGPAALWFDADVLAGNAADLGVAVERLDERALAASYPGLSFEPEHIGLVQRDAFILNPRAIVRAQLAAATAAGATLIRDVIISTTRTEDGVLLRSAAGREWTAGQVVLATGAASNATGLLPRPLRMAAFGATVVLAQVADPAALSDMPTMMFLKHRDGERLFGGIVMAPRPYPDGNWYVKLSGDSLKNYPLQTAEQIAAWARTGGDQADIAEARAVLADLLPDVEFGPFSTRPCLVSATANDRPFIDRVDARTVIAVEGERGAMAAIEIGRLTADLTQGPWTDTIPHEVFQAQWDDAAPASDKVEK